MVDRLIGIGLAAAGAIFSLVAPVLFDRIPRQWAKRGFWASIVIFVVACTTLLIPAGGQQPAPAITGNCNAVGNDNSNCSPYIVNPGRISLTPKIESELLAKIPKDKPGHIVVLGLAMADQNVGTQIFEFLKQHGYSVGDTPERDGMTIPMPDHPLTLSDSPTSKSWTLVVAPTAH